MKLLLAFVALIGLSGCSPEPCTAQSSPMEGLYLAKSDDGYWDYLRFCRDKEKSPVLIFCRQHKSLHGECHSLSCA
jgi:hypothetical protein